MPLKDIKNYCEVCKVHYEGGYLAYTEHNASHDHKVVLQIDSLIQHMKYAAERIAEINAEVKLKPFIPRFNGVDSCDKCDTRFEASTTKKPLKYYNPVTNTLTRTCPCCGYSWKERCADDSDPNWEKIE